MIKLNIDKLNYNFFYTDNDKKNIYIPKYQNKVNDIHKKIVNRTTVGSEMLEWMDQPKFWTKHEIDLLKSKANQLRKDGVKKLLVIGIGGSFLASKACISFLGDNESIDRESLIFGGVDASSSTYRNISRALKSKQWGICVISLSGSTLETNMAFNYFELKLIKEIGALKARKRIVVITNETTGILVQIAKAKSYMHISIPLNVGGRFSYLTATHLFPLAFAKVDIKKIIVGSMRASKELSASNINENDAYKYAILRYLLSKKKISLFPNKSIVNNSSTTPILKMKKSYLWDVLISYDSDLIDFTSWYQQLAAESEGKIKRTLFPIISHFSRDLHSLGQIISDGKRDIIETTFWVKNTTTNSKLVLPKSSNSKYQNMNLEGKKIEDINEKIFKSSIHAHSKVEDIPNIIFEIENKSEESLGYIWYFFSLSITMNCYLMGINPFNQPGVEGYKSKLNSLLKE